MPLPACTLYASPNVANGSGNTGLTEGQAVSLTDAAALTEPGSVVCLLDGTYQRTSPFMPTICGTASEWIMYRALNPGGATIRWNSGTANQMFYFRTETGQPINYIEVNGLIFDGNEVAHNGIFCQNPNGVSLYPHHLRFIDNTIHSTGSSGIACIRCDYITAIGNKIHNVGMTTGWGSGIVLNTNVWQDQSPEFHNFVLDNIISGIYDIAGVNRTDDPGDDTDITDGNGIIVDRSDVDDDTPPTLIANNVIFQCGGRAIASFHASNVWIVNNTCYQNSLDLLLGNDEEPGLPDIGDIKIGADSANNYVFNNIVHSWSPRYSFQLMSNSDALFKANLWYGGLGLDGVAGDPDAFTNGDPLFLNAPAVDQTDTVGEQYLNALDPELVTVHFLLKTGSPAIDAGVDPRTVSGQEIILRNGTVVTDISALVSAMTTYLLADIAGRARPSDGVDWDLGAYHDGRPALLLVSA